MKKTLSATIAIVSAPLLAGTILVAPAMAAPTEPVPSPTELSELFGAQEQPRFEEISKNLSSAELELIESGVPAVIYQEVETGKIITVEEWVQSRTDFAYQSPWFVATEQSSND
ncbi:hypothetical protein [Arthrobacter sp. MYb213]|uniref:hypothetical protein n=1 Tax=Arthrobacter sp. MYb213 TaxID=1848595 RepID=UPI000CFCC8A0|nr:hypothetical protein [Arthrobacter sp. MYb213]PRB68773.1 hypothetical protein CQ011_13665 [Arthrobacter sp. MYb213]